MGTRDPLINRRSQALSPGNGRVIARLSQIPWCAAGWETPESQAMAGVWSPRRAETRAMTSGLMR
jgi:hypothetical protein